MEQNEKKQKQTPYGQTTAKQYRKTKKKTSRK